MIVHKKLNSIITIFTFQTLININEYRFTTMIESNATKKFYVIKFDKKKTFIYSLKKNVYNLIIINENSLFNENEKMNTKTKSLSITIQQHHEKLIFDIVQMITYDVILKMF